MIRIATGAAALAMMFMLAACNQTGAGSAAISAATALDPTGLSGTAIGLAESAQPERDPDPKDMDFSSFAPRLSDIAAGNMAGPDYLREFDKQASQMMAEQAADTARSVGQEAIDGVLSGGLSLAGAGPSLAMQGLRGSMLAGQLAAARGQINASVAQGEAQRAAEQFLPNGDRPAEARAVLSIIDRPVGSNASWKNPETGASGRVTLKSRDRNSFGGLDCRILTREATSSRTGRISEMLACRNKGEWYDFSY
ncbi:hypothetical protein [Microvirga terrestris]|uniref:Surface antigen domain-containing protein n=1 Tax=Microvirga terrestris TaxID=2791024 RepID=A0ABS0HS40_9HYPH|nr:hypothetical protein [Microvirga terrestris]MBF9196302.1 hypothetical protein [Microvirga terrestris]